MDFEKNVFNIDNEGDIYHADELNKIQQGKERFHSGQERFVSSEKNEDHKEINDLASSLRDKEDKKTIEGLRKKTNPSTSLGGATSGIGASTIAIPGIIVSVVSVVATIGVATGLIKTPASNHVSVFLSRSTELGFEIDRDPDKAYMMYLTNKEYSFYEAIDFIDQVVFKDLIPNTVYDLKVYETTIDPYKLVYSGNYLTAAYDDYYSSITNVTRDNDLLTFNVEYEGSNIDFVTVIIYGDNNTVIYKYEGAPINELTVNVAGYENVTCKVFVNGQMTHFEQLFGQEIIHVSSVSLDTSSLRLSVGDTYAFETAVLPENATNKELIWSSSDDSVVSVDNGTITALKEGKATITVKSKDGYKSSSAEIKVVKKPSTVPVSSVSLNETSLDLLTGDRVTLTATVLPSNATDKTISWSSSDESVATVKNGKVTALSAGQATITATTNDGGLTASCIVNVTQKIIPVNGVSLNYSELELSVGDSENLIAKVLPTNVTNKEVIWYSTDDEVASVDENGKVTALKVGETMITITTVDGGYKDYCIIKVTA